MSAPKSLRNIWDELKFNRIVCPGDISVELVHACPETYTQSPDSIIASAARISFNNFGQIKSLEQDARLIDYLFRNRHTSPFEMATLTFVIKAPKFVTIQLLRHRTFRFNEESQRYSVIREGFFRPSSNPQLFIRVPDKKNKQASRPNNELAEKALDKIKAIEDLLDQINEQYQELIKLGVARECARFCLPMATWSHIVVQADMNNLTKFLSLRLASDAQYEIQLVARALYFLTRQVFPMTMKSFKRHMFNSETMSLDDSGFQREFTSKYKTDLET